MSRLLAWLDRERPPQAAVLGWRCFQLGLLLLPASALLAGLLFLVALIHGSRGRAPWWHDRLNLLLTAGRMTSATRTLIVNAVAAVPANANAGNTRVATAVALTMVSPEFIVQK